MSLYFDNFGGSGRPAWTNTLAPPAPSKPSGPPPGMVYNQAQPIQPPSQGTPYGQQPKAAPKQTDFSAYKPQQQAPANPFTQYNPQQMGNFAQQQMGLPSFQFTATDPFGNTYNNPAALTAQQGAMAQALNQQRAQQIQSGNIGQLNPMAAYQQAQNMVQGGWTNPFAMPDSQQMGTMGGPARDPRWSHNGGQWQSGQAQPIQPPSQGTPYGGGNNPSVLGYPTPLPGAAQVLGYPSYLDDIKRKQYEQYLREQGPAPPRTLEQAQPVPPPSQGTPYGQPAGGAPPFDPDYAKWRGQQVQTMEYRGPEGEAARERAMRQRYERERGGDQPPSPDAYYPGDVFFPRPGQAQPVQPPSPGTQYGTPPDQRGQGRTAQFIDRDRDGVDDRDQDGPGMPRYGQPPVGSPRAPSPAQAGAGQPQNYQPYEGIRGGVMSAPKTPSYAEERRSLDESAYRELLSQIRVSGGSTAAQDRRKRDLERRLGVDAGGQKPLPPSQAQPIQPPSQGTPYGQSLQASPARPGYTRTPDGRLLYSGPPEVGLQAPPRREGFERDAVGMPVLRAPQVWTNPSDPEWLKRELQSKPDTRPVVWDEANRRYIKNPYLAGGPARPDAAAPLQRYEPGFAYARR